MEIANTLLSKTLHIRLLEGYIMHGLNISEYSFLPSLAVLCVGNVNSNQSTIITRDQLINRPIGNLNWQNWRGSLN